MNQNFNRTAIGDGVYFSRVCDTKFKHNRITASLFLPLDEKTATENAIVPFILRRGSAAYPDFTRLNLRLCELYGASLSCDVAKYGSYQALELTISAIDDRFTPDSSPVTQECAQLLTEILLRPNMPGGVFNEKDVEVEKLELVDTIESLLNDKRSYALTRCRSLLCEGEPVALEKYGNIEAARALTPEQAARAYERAIQTAHIEIMFIGCGDGQAALDIFTKELSGRKRSPIALEKQRWKELDGAGEPKQKTERLDVAQGKLVIGMRVPPAADDSDILATSLMSAVFGGTPNSRLFVYVREKLSLCYYCASRFDKISGLLFVDSGVEPQNRDKAQEEILRQLDIVREGGFTDEEMQAALLLMQTSRAAVGDSLGALESWYMTQIVCGEDSSPADESQRLEKITREQVMQAAGRVKADAIYFLTGKEAQ